MTDNPQWHDFPYQDGVYAIKDHGFVTIVNIFECSGIGRGVWYFRCEGSTYSYKFEPKDYTNKIYGPIKLPKIHD